MAFAARRSLASRFSHHLTRRFHPSVPHLLTRSNDDDPPSPSSQPQPLPSFRSPLPPASRAAQTLHHLLPFSLHHSGLPRRGFSSSAPAPAPDPPGEVDAAASVLVDAAEAVASSVPAPFPGEVAAAAADSFFPVAALQYLIDYVHTFTGLNWWACIVLTTVLIRTATIPVLVSQLKSSQKLNAIKPEMEAIKDAMDSPDPKAALEGKYKMTALFQKHGVSPFSPLKGMLIQGPMFMSFFFAINNMVEKVPSMKAGGVFWFTDLTTPDPLYICPVLAALTFLVTVELNLQEGMEGNSMADKMKTFSRGMALMTVPFTMNFAKGIFCYWVTSNLFSLVYGIVIRRPAVRKLFNLPAWEAPSAPALNSALNMFGGSKAVPSEKSPLALTAAQQSSLEKPDAAALGYRVKNLEKKGKSRAKSRKRR
ncbi:mitochondrial inner membrane protein OXA1-like [Triticum dicoccoides]|uniref:Membrane insertase YidC/Oxa/ALB C-terminal domain-containing protein n=1 Tax=Triticum turgidum subsp. durum TaxID=4567 RepID=A0A9R0UW74_TRITD|nr:mitochondrial inner membrane protein OXA1-like [Triticum dicoccoides]VAH05525.1 unnamed protein product [Triticum turgidum subsp. durum]